MSWLRLALGLMREAASTEVGQEIINDLKENAFGSGKQKLHQMENIDQMKTYLEERMQLVDRNIEMLVQMLNVQHDKLVEINRRQRLWNLTLAGVALTAIITASLR